MLDTFEIVIAAFSGMDKGNQVRFFEETFLLVYISPKVVLRMLFLTLNSANVNFLGQKLWWKTYTTKKTFPITRCIELVGKKVFATAMLDPEHEIYIVYVGSVSSIALSSSFPLNANVHLFCRPRVSGLIVKEVSTKVPAKYSDFADVFSLDLASKLSKYTKINNYNIKLVDGQQLSYKPIYSLGPVELETLKAYIETNLVNGFIKSSKLFAGTSILFD